VATKETLVTVVIPNYNYASYLAGAIESALGQSHRSREVIVVDDGSTDQSRQVIDAYGQSVRALFGRNQGVSAARNVGVQYAQGTWVAFLDADDNWLPTKIEEQLRTAERAGAEAAVTDIQLMRQDGTPLDQTIVSKGGCLLNDIAMLRTAAPGPGSTLLARRTLLASVGGFDSRLSTSADWDLVRRLVCRTSLASVRRPLTRYRIHPAAMHHRVDVLERDMILAFEKMFADPMASEIHPFRGRCYGRLYAMLAGSFLHAGCAYKAAKYAFKSAIASPQSLAYVVGTPLRMARRMVSPSRQY
jgi:glycosyltransferase involved in cell wall biosynthesis